ncbi:LPXTG cell wall anchor domain-containing protein [Micromonospora sp. C95]|uniref:LPXTG cell wall anchor domain-containing protein n=1 Tax=Micromonospora sp. C95 TaxID=2824882 RepID=UPI001B358B59|nr:LPXTG cell wall anchor domain-containing protein [Micromonospora sp. C95]MBQ1028254.1 LPXTG cell wall anchor domain-containing protein [Micromonospora sp. C95]
MKTLRPVMALTMVLALLLGTASPAVAVAVTITSGAPRSPMVLGQVYAIHTVEATGGTEPYRLSVSAGSLPPGMLVVGTSLGGSPTMAGTYAFTLRMTDAADQFAEQNATIEVREPTIEITSGAPRSPMVLGQVYAIHTVEATGGTEPYRLSVSAGSLPPGMLVVGTSLGGSPTTAGTYPATLRMTDKNGFFGEQDVTIVVAEPATATPTATPTGPSPTPTGPSATPTGPSATPTGPSATPTGPSATPTGPSATPTAPTATPTPVDPTSTPSTSPAAPVPSPSKTSGAWLPVTGSNSTIVLLSLGVLAFSIGGILLVVTFNRRRRFSTPE